MGIKMHFDFAGNIEYPTLVLAYKNGRKISNILNIDNFVMGDSLTDGADIVFRVHKKLDNNTYKDWDKLNDFKLLWIPEWDKWFSITVEINQDDETVKNVSAIGLGQSELSQTKLFNVEINTETDISRDDYTEPTIFYNPEHPESSLLDRLMSKASHYTLKHVDPSLMYIQRTFSFDDKSLYDAFQEIAEEINCLFVFDAGSSPDGKPSRAISVYDLEANCQDCGYRGIYVNKCPKCESTNVINGYGNDTTIFFNKDNLIDKITYTTDTNSVKNCFKLEAGDDLMTATVRACNPNGSDYLYNIPNPDRQAMSPELQSKLKEYDNLYDYYQTDYPIDLTSDLRTAYNNLIKKYKQYNENLQEIPETATGYPQLMEFSFDVIDMALLLQSTLMPNITLPELTAQQQVDSLISELPTTVGTTSLTGLSLSTADNIVLSYARSIIYSAFKVEIGRSTLSGTTWNGNFVITSYSDKDDTATSRYISININDNYQAYVKQRIEKILNKADQDTYGITGLFKQSDDVFKSELKKYSLNRLNSFYSSCQACLDIMVQSKVSDPNGENSDIYSSLYVPYLNKLQYIQDEINVRDKEIRIVQGYYNNQGILVTTGLQQELIKKRDEIQSILNFENFVGEELWKEFLSFRREDKYSNTNFISDGLNNAELFQNAKEFIEKASKELYKSSNLQHSITSELKNFMRMKEFAPIMDNFEVGNWLRAEIDGEIYQLRLISYELDFEDADNASLVFSDLTKTTDGFSDIKSIFDKATNMANSYDSLKQQSITNTQTTKDFSDMVAKGLNMTNMKIISDADFQNISWDEHGLLCREFNDIIDGYNPTQLKIINDGVYITDNAWKTARTGIGRFIYFDPKDGKYKEGYGVIADTIVSNLILSEEVGIYNEEKSIEMGKDGIIVTTNTTNKNVFTIQKEYTDDDGNVFLERQLYIDDNGNIVLGGGSKISWDNVIGGSDYVNSAIGNVEVDITNLQNFVNQNVESLQNQIDGKIDTYRQDTDPSLAWSDEEKPNHVGDWWYDTNTQSIKVYNGATWDISTADVPEEVWNQISGKAQIFTTTPTPPYNIGDLWVQGENGDIMRCKVAKVEGDTYDSSDWVKASKYTDDTTANEALGKVNDLSSDYNTLKEILGYNGTTITGTFIYSPHIVGGDISIGSSSSGVQAQIKSDGKLIATGAEINGTIYATALTLGSGVKIDYSNISNAPTIPDTSIFIRRDGIIGSTPSDGTTGFTVSSNGLLQASNAIIYGTIYASSGLIGGFSLNSNCLYSGNSYLGGSGVYVSPNGISCNSTFKVTSSGFLTAKTGEIAGFTFSDTLNDSTHAYANTLYRVINGSDGYDYQAGIKAASATNGETEAAFYVRKKSSSDSTWANSSLPFYVRNNGYVYCEDLTIGNSLYMNINPAIPGNSENDGDYVSKRFKIVNSYLEGIQFGLINSNIYISCNDSGFGFWINNKSPLSIWVESPTEFIINPVKNLTNFNVDLGSSGNTFRCLYVDSICLNGVTKTAWPSGSGTDSISLKINGTTRTGTDFTSYDLALKAHTHSNSDINWSTQYGYKGFGHTHTIIMNNPDKAGSLSKQRAIALTNDDTPALIPFKFTSFTNVDNNTLDYGGTTNLGNSSYHWNTLYVDNIVLGSNSSINSWSGLGGSGITSVSSSGSGNAVTGYSVSTDGKTLTLSKGSTFSLSGHSHTEYGTQLYVSGTTLYLRNSNGSNLDYVTLPNSSGSSGLTTIQGTHYLSSSTPSFGINISSNLAFAVGNNSSNTKGNYISMGNLYNYSGSSGKMVYVNSGGTLYSASSSKRYKHDIVPLDINHINKLYDLDVVTYKYNADHFDDINDPDINKTFIGMIAEDIAEICPTLAVYDSQGRVEMWDEFQFPACLLALVQNNHKEISSLKSENSLLKSQNQQQQDTINQLMNQLLLLQGEVSILKDKMEESQYA